MKTILLIAACISLQATFAQTPEALDEIMKEIATPLSEGQVDAVLNRLVYPFEAGEKKYTRATLKTAFSKVFVEGSGACLLSKEHYQVAMPGDDTWCLAVCYAAPEGYDAAVYSFRLVDEKWMLESIDLQKD